MSRNPIQSRPFWTRPPKVDVIRTTEDVKRWWKNTATEIVGTDDPRSMMEVARDTIRFLMNDPSVPFRTRLDASKFYIESVIGKAEVRVHSTGDGTTNLTLVEEQTQQLFINDPDYRAKVIEAESYAFRAIGTDDRGDEPGEVRADREPGPLGDEAAPGDPQPADDRPGGAED